MGAARMALSSWIRAAARMNVQAGHTRARYSFGFACGKSNRDVMKADLLLFNGRITTLDPTAPEAEAIAIEDGHIAAVGATKELMQRFPEVSRRIDLEGRRAIPGINDSHMHVIRGGLNYNLE